MTKRKFAKTTTAVALTVIMLFSLLMPCLTMVASANTEYTGGVGTKISDLDTSLKYALSLGDNASTEYAGRIWTDKSVYDEDVTFETYGGGTSTIKLNENNNKGEDFLVAYSALATAQSVSGSTQAPVDVVFVIDTSGSMNDDMSSTDRTNRIVNTINALNKSIDAVMKLNEYTRVAVVAFANTSEVLLPLGHYEKGTREIGGGNNQQTITDYFSLGNSQQRIYVHAKNTETQATVSSQRDVTGGTNIQRGIYEGMNVLATAQNTSVSVNGAMVQRVPSLVLLSDGAPTRSSDSTAWWAPGNNYNDGPGSSAYYGNGMKALMTGAYMKEAVNRKYGVSGTKMGMTVYTIGMGITGLSNYEQGWFGVQSYTGERDLARVTLNPKKYLSEDNSMSNSIRSAWQTYITNNGRPSVSVSSGDSYVFSHPTSYDIDTDADALINLVDDHYDADNAEAVAAVFEEIVSNIALSTPEVPTELKGTDPISDGYIIYTDPIGEYMEVKDVKAIIYAGYTFTSKNVTTEGNLTTYVFEGTVDSAIYGHQELKYVIITVEENNGKQILTVKIPASVIPLRVNTVELNKDGTIKTHTNNGAFPTRIIYSVGLKSDVTKVANNGNVYIDRSKISSTYLNANSNSDGTINFYSNLYTNKPDAAHDHTVGDATVEFEPSHTNEFYYIVEDMPIYKLVGGNYQQVPASETIEPDKNYYYCEEYYHATTVENKYIERTGAQLLATSVIDVDGYKYRAAGSPRLNRILEFEGRKTVNATKTAEAFYAPTFHHADGNPDPYAGKFVVYLGNNGVLSVIGGGNLEISKTVVSNPGVSAPVNKVFEFTLDLDGQDVNDGIYDYVITDATGVKVSDGTVSKYNNKIYLKDGEKATILSLPPETTYVVVETAVAGFTTQSTGASGKITAGNTSTAAFTNTYSVEPIEFPTNGTLLGKKVISGRNWDEANDEFTFFIVPFNNAPLPEGYDSQLGKTVSKPDANSTNTASFEFGNITFTAPGYYRYTIYEKVPGENEILAGMSYSQAVYRLAVTVEDNGDGTIRVASYDLQQLYTDDGVQLFTSNAQNNIVMNPGYEAQDEIVFVNTYSANDVVRVPSAMKLYTDNSGENPLVSHMFEFKLEAVGIVENGVVVDNTANSVPMPSGSTNNAIITTNVGHNITFPGVTFKHQHVINNAPTTYRYTMSEVVPANKVNGMTYDSRVYTIDVTVSINPGNEELVVVPVFSNGQNTITFENSYTPNSTKVSIDGEKVLNGRDMKAGESFEFVLGMDDKTSNAVNDGIVVVPTTMATVTGAKAGQSSAFAFADIEFKKAGTYNFTVTETQGNALSVDYDKKVVNVTVVVDDNDKDGNLSATVTYSTGDAAAKFVNTYTSTFNGASVNLTGNKLLTGKTLLQGEFYFNVEEHYNYNAVGSYMTTHLSDETADSNGVYSGFITFLEDVTYDKAGTYEYYITEVQPQVPVGGTTYDQSKFRYTVVVKDDWNGNLVIDNTKLEKQNGSTWSTADEIVFSNTYVPTPVTDKLPVISKVVSGDRKDPLKAGEFEFKLELVSQTTQGGIELPSTTVVANDANGNVIFDSIKFIKAGRYVVSVTEVVPDDSDKVPGITYSTQVITAEFEVVDDRIGNLSVVLTQFVGGDSIVNEYKADSVEAEIEISKDFTGRENDEWLSTDKFDFEIIPDAETLTAIENGNVEFTLDNNSDKVIVTIGSKGETVIKKIKFNKPGSYVFTIKEVDGGIAGVDYSEEQHTVNIVVTDDSQNAKLVVAINGNDTDKHAVKFTNTYVAEDTDIVINAIKNLEGRELVDGEFKFVIKDKDGKVVATATNTVDGKIVFDKITITDVGTYIYTVYEEVGTLEGVTYDETEYIVEIVVTDNREGKLVQSETVIKKAGSDVSVAEVVFENIYTESPKSPQTGDNSNINFFIVLFAVSVGALTVLAVFNRKKASTKR